MGWTYFPGKNVGDGENWQKYESQYLSWEKEGCGVDCVFSFF
jgi:hypothetical protein